MTRSDVSRATFPDPPSGAPEETAPARSGSPLPLAELRADCSRCFGLCCVALPFTRSSDFPVSKEAGTPCRHLDGGFACGIHADLRSEGFRGCTVFDCFGAGQRASQVTFTGRSWCDAPDTAEAMFTVFGVLRGLHELVWYLTEVLDNGAAHEIHDQVHRVRADIVALTEEGAEALADVDVTAHRDRIAPLLARASALIRARVPGPVPDHRRADLAGARLARTRLRGADLRGACLIAADLRGADLRDTDLLGADLRDCDLRDADLTDGFFITQPQVNAAVGNRRTRLPDALTRPTHW